MLSRPMLDRTAFWGISYYAILIVAAIIIGYFISTSRARKYGLPDDIILNLLLLGIPLAIICARLYYVFFRFSYYAEHIQHTGRRPRDLWRGPGRADRRKDCLQPGKCPDGGSP